MCPLIYKDFRLSNPLNSESRAKPETTILILYKGYNLVSYPAETMEYGNLYNLMEALGGSAVISRVHVFDPVSQTFAEVGYDDTGQPYGQNHELLAGQGLPGLIIYAKEDMTFPFNSKYCHVWNLRAGANLAGTACVPSGLSAFQLLPAIGDETVVSSIQRYNPGTGKFETAGYRNGQAIGVDFSIKAGEGYFIHMIQDVPGFRP